MTHNAAFSTPFALSQRARADIRTQSLRTPACHRHAPVRRVHRMTIAIPTPQPSAPQKEKEHSLPPRVADLLSRAHEGDPMRTLQFAEKAFNTWKTAGRRPFTKIVYDERDQTDDVTPDVDVVIAGGTLGVFYATALAARGVRVALVERGRVQGRAQEWNISWGELEALVEQGVLTRSELDAAIVGQFPAGSRIAFPPTSDGNRREINVRDVLDVGVDPAALVASARARFIALGGALLEHASLERVGVRTNSVRLVLRAQQRGPRAGDGASGAGGTGAAPSTAADAAPTVLRARLLVDAMGAFSPIAAQSREGARPDGACIVVGSCARGPVGENTSADLLAAIDGIDTDQAVQRFWEAFPAGRDRDRRTTYMFSYGPCDETRETLTDALDDYARLLPRYQGFEPRDVDVERVLFAFFPVFKDSPARVAFDRVLPVGDAAGFQALSVLAALAHRMQFYAPSLSVTWLFNRAMAVDTHNVPRGGLVDAGIVNDLLYCNMKAMEKLGPNVQKPFLQDVVRAGGLTKTIASMMVSDPVLSAKTAVYVGPSQFVRWIPHYLALVLYTLLAPVAMAVKASIGEKLNDRQQYRLNRLVDALTYGSGLDIDVQHHS
eukprot:IDg22604t1